MIIRSKPVITVLVLRIYATEENISMFYRYKSERPKKVTLKK